MPSNFNLLDIEVKRHIYYIPMNSEKLTLDGLIDTGALTSAISEQDLNKIKVLANEAIKETGPPPNFRIMVAKVADFKLKRISSS